ncbi:hypothetical protein [Halobellus rubicundus]|uniref:DUF8131 domain-containing protein n=1 Tax=Halobellus rubicundus TaxID=2996466 RepID=A0ABD5MD20_9EURY
MNLGPQFVAAVLLLALVPVAAFALAQTGMAAVALVNVLLIFGCLYYVLSVRDEPLSPVGE